MTKPYKSQHFVPAFLLRRWESGQLRKLVAFRWDGDRFLFSRCKADSVAKRDHLYSMAQESEAPDVSLERCYLGPEVDDKAAVALTKLETAGVEGLSQQERHDWTRFLVAQTLRSPDAVQRMRNISKSFMAQRITAQLREAGIVADESFLASAPELSDAAMKAFPYAVESSPFWSKISSSTWELLKFEGIDSELLIGDDPVSLDIDDAAGIFTLAIPIGPKSLLVVSTEARQLERQRWFKADVLLSMNEQMVEQSPGSVYATSEKCADFIKSRLPRSSKHAPRHS